ncbi:MAG: hypothetical protein ACHQYP_00330 [Nitrospiria bacterium]
MSKVLGGMLGAGLLSGMIFSVQPIGAESENPVDRDLNVKGGIGLTSERDKTEIGELERDSNHENLPKGEDNEIRKGIGVNNEPQGKSEHESGNKKSRDENAIPR